MVFLGSFATGFITGQFPNAVAGTDYNFFPWPGGGNAGVTGGANIVYAFNSNPSTCSLMSWLESAAGADNLGAAGRLPLCQQECRSQRLPDSVERRRHSSCRTPTRSASASTTRSAARWRQPASPVSAQYLANPSQLRQHPCQHRGATRALTQRPAEQW